MSELLVQLQARLGYTFREPALLERALTHTSYLQDHPKNESNERFEFLGDAVLQLVLTEALFQLFPADREGLLSKRRASLARGVTLVALARELGLDACLRLGASEESTGGRARASTQEDAFEAVVGAVYLDSDFATARRIVLALYGALSDRLSTSETEDNPKGRLQELIQPVHGNHALRYEVIHTAGEDHARTYRVEVFLNTRSLGAGEGTSKKLAEEAAARVALAQKDLI